MTKTRSVPALLIFCLTVMLSLENIAATPVEAGELGKGSAIFLHCTAPMKPYTGGCVAIPQDKMRFALQRVRPDCVVLIDSLKNIAPSVAADWGVLQ